jgi:hypothetical protein
MQIIAGRQVYSISGKIIGLDAGASDADLEKAVSQAAHVEDGAEETA